jgi:hypothetical protein
MVYPSWHDRNMPDAPASPKKTSKKCEPAKRGHTKAI